MFCINQCDTVCQLFFNIKISFEKRVNFRVSNVRAALSFMSQSLRHTQLQQSEIQGEGMLSPCLLVGVSELHYK